MSQQAVDAFTKANLIQEAIDSCVELNQWDLAVELAKKHHIKETDALLAKYARHLLDKDKILDAVELYRKANHFIEAAKLLQQIAKEASAQSLDPAKIKKIYVLSALMVEQHRSLTKQQLKKTKAEMNSSGDKKGEVQSTLQGLLTEDYSSSSETALLDNAWRGAEAYHFFMLAQKQLYNKQVEASLKTSLILCDYEDILPVVDIYSLVALTSSASNTYGVCSKAFIELESLGTDVIGEEQRQLYEDLAVEIFTKHPPKDKIQNKLECPTCDTVVKSWVTCCPSCDTHFPVCVASGQPLLDFNSWVCSTCKHRAYSYEVGRFINCPLCHALIRD